jgi:hypothetical protein
MFHPAHVIAFHGCDEDVGESILSGHEAVGKAKVYQVRDVRKTLAAMTDTTEKKTATI